MDDNVVNFNGITKLDMPPDRILEAAMGKLDYVVIVGHCLDGNEYFASSKSDAGEVVWAFERAKHKLMRMVDEMSGAT
jgi:hypothetical protein